MSENDQSKDYEVTTADHIHSFGSGAVTGGTIGLVIDYTSKMEMSTMEGLGVAIAAGAAVGFVEGIAETAAGIKYRKQRLTGAFGIGAGIVVAGLLTGMFEEEADNILSAIEPANIEVVDAQIQQGAPIAINGDDVIFAPA